MTEPAQGELRLDDLLAEIEREIKNEIEQLRRERAKHEGKHGAAELPNTWAPPLVVE